MLGGSREPERESPERVGRRGRLPRNVFSPRKAEDLDAGDRFARFGVDDDARDDRLRVLLHRDESGSRLRNRRATRSEAEGQDREAGRPPDFSANRPGPFYFAFAIAPENPSPGLSFGISDALETASASRNTSSPS